MGVSNMGVSSEPMQLYKPASEVLSLGMDRSEVALLFSMVTFGSLIPAGCSQSMVGVLVKAAFRATVTHCRVIEWPVVTIGGGGKATERRFSEGSRGKKK